MNPLQALQILDQMVARAPLTRQDHVAAQQAVATLRQFIQTAGTPLEQKDGTDISTIENGSTGTP